MLRAQVAAKTALGREAKKIMDANPEKPLNLQMMRRLWRMLIKVVYDFADESERMAKLLDVSLQ